MEVVTVRRRHAMAAAVAEADSMGQMFAKCSDGRCTTGIEFA